MSQMIKRKDGSYSRRGLWDNIRANRGSGKKPTKQMLAQEKKIKAESKSMKSGGRLYQAYKSGGTIPHTTKGPRANYRPTKSGAGMTAKGVAAYRRANPGSKLQTAVTGKVKPGSKDANRRKSYCARSLGQLRQASEKTKNDPNSRIRQARRRWKC
jgi:hypothetical protein